jgi:hypothetical protein
MQWAVTCTVVCLSGFPFTPLYVTKEHFYMTLLESHPVLAVVLKTVDFAVAVFLMRFIFVSILDSRRFTKGR